MTRIILLERLKDAVETAARDLILPVRVQKDGQKPAPRAAHVYLMRLPDMKAATQKCPYIILQLVWGNDRQEPGQPRTSAAMVRLVFSVYHPDEQEGALALLDLMERVRIALLKEPVVGGQFALDEAEGLETGINYDLEPPYYNGEMVGTWTVPAVEREDIRAWL